MARNKTLEQLVEDLRLETGRSSNANLGIADRPALVRILARIYETIYEQNNFPHLIIERDKELQEGSRYYDFPTEIDPERVLKVQRKWAGKWDDVARGITMEDYNAYDGDDEDVMADPILKWRMLDTAANGSHAIQWEAWPRPASDYDSDTGDGLVRFTGIRKFVALTTDSSICRIDSNIVVLHAAAELLAKVNKADAAAKLAEGQKALKTAMKNLQHKTPRNKFNINGGDPHSQQAGHGQRILVAQVVREE